MKSACFFIGHRDAPSSLQTTLNAVVEQHINKHCVREFYVGHYGKFDSMAANAVITAKMQHPQVKLILLLPHHPASHPFNLPLDFDASVYPFDHPVPPRYAIPRANEYMIDHCSYLITYIRHPGKSRDFLEYAQHKSASHPLITQL